MLSREALLAERIGYAHQADVAGGAEPYLVENLDDAGPGSLRYGCGLGGRFITLAPGVTGTLRLPTAIDVAGDTLLCLGAGITLVHDQVPTPEAQHHGLVLRGANIGVTYTKLMGNVPDWVNDSCEGTDGIHIGLEATDRIWVHRCTIKEWGDGCIDTETHTDAGTSPDRLAITWNNLGACRLPLNLWAGKVSFGYNRVADLNGRGPKITRGKLHSYNNIIKRWGNASVRQTNEGGQIYSQGDMFIPGDQPKIGTFGGPIKHEGWKVFGSGSVTFVAGPNNVDPAFVTEAVACSGQTVPSTSTEWSALRQSVEAAGV